MWALPAAADRDDGHDEHDKRIHASRSITTRPPPASILKSEGLPRVLHKHQPWIGEEALKRLK